MNLSKALKIALPIAVMVSPFGAMAQVNSCNPESLGQVSCQRATLCQCQYFSGGAITGAPDGYRWDCSALRPRCESAADTLSQAAPLVAPSAFGEEDNPGVSMFAGLTNGIASFGQRLRQAVNAGTVPARTVLVGEGLSPVPEGAAVRAPDPGFPPDGPDAVAAAPIDSWRSYLFAPPKRRVAKTPVPMLGHRYLEQAALAKERELRLQVEITALRASLGAERRRTAALEAQRQDLTTRNTDLWDTMLDMREVQQVVLERVSEHTLLGIDALEDTVAITGVALDKLLPAEPPTDPNLGRGGPFILKGQSAEIGLIGPVQADLGLLDKRIARWQKLQALLGSLPLIAPLDQYRISSKFGPRPDPVTGKSSRHYGIDLVGKRGTSVFATAPGKVVFAGRKGFYGNLVEIDHGFGIRTRYAHLQKIHVRLGQQLGHREVVGLLGSSGRSTGAHVHYEVLVLRRHKDPMKFLDAGLHLFKNIGKEPARSVATVIP